MSLGVSLLLFELFLYIKLSNTPKEKGIIVFFDIKSPLLRRNTLGRGFAYK